MKLFGWGTNPDYAIQVSQGGRGKWRWTVRHHGVAVALSPVQGWATADEAKLAAEAFLNGIGADHLAIQEADKDWTRYTEDRLPQR